MSSIQKQEPPGSPASPSAKDEGTVKQRLLQPEDVEALLKDNEAAAEQEKKGGKKFVDLLVLAMTITVVRSRSPRAHDHSQSVALPLYSSQIPRSLVAETRTEQRVSARANARSVGWGGVGGGAVSVALAKWQLRARCPGQTGRG